MARLFAELLIHYLLVSNGQHFGNRLQPLRGKAFSLFSAGHTARKAFQPQSEKCSAG